jgi:hypothetical protein
MKRPYERVSRVWTCEGDILKYAYSFLDLLKNRVSAAAVEAYSRIVWPSEPL